MGTASVAVRCLRCGDLVTLPAPAAASIQWYACPHCSAPVPAVPPRDPAPLFSWEVYPHLYPPLPVPRPPRVDGSRVVVVTLVIATALVVVAGGFLFYLGAAALTPGSTTVAGTVFAVPSPSGPGGPAANVAVNLTGENNFEAHLVTGPTGTFRFTGVPDGGIAVNASKRGYAPVTVDLFASAVYVSSPTSAVNIVLQSGPNANGTTAIDTPFLDLESFVSTVWSGTILFGIAAIFTGLGAWLTFRHERPVVGIAGGAAALLAPVSLSLLGILGLFPLLSGLGEGLVVVGVIATVLLVISMARTGRAADFD